MQSHSTLPTGVRARISRCPMPNAGVVSMVVSPVARRRNLLLYAFRNRSSVVQDWPDAGTNCRWSMQIGHAPGGASEGGYCVPQAVQMKAGMTEGYTRVAVRAIPVGQSGNTLGHAAADRAFGGAACLLQQRAQIFAAG